MYESQEEGGRYVVQSFDEYTWSLVDIATGNVYALALNELSNLIVHLSLTEVATNTESPRFMMYLREILSCRFEVSSMAVALEIAGQVIDKLQEGDDIDNPIEVAFLLSADLHGQSAVGHNERAH